jgi:outer membrane protein assembly factor BamB
MKTYGTPLREWPYGMLSLAGGNLLLYGSTQRSMRTGDDLYAVRVTSDGEIVWEYTTARSESELIIDAIETSAGDLVLCVVHNEDPMLVVLDAAGTPLWQIVYELPGWQYASQIAETTSGDFFLVGFEMAASGPRQADVWLARATPDGALLWETSLGRPGEDDYAQSLLPLSDGTYLIGGLGRGLPLFIVDEDGTILWERRLDSTSVYAANGLAQTADGAFFVAGFKMLVNGRSYDAVLLEVDREAVPGS